MKLEVGMYVRTLFGIKKIDHIDNKKTVWKYLYKINDDNEFYALSDNDVIKASHNILDLIEVGDYVNGWLVEEIRNDRVISSQYNFCDICNDFERKEILKEDIKSIVTKEQFESMKYSLEG